LEQTENEYAMSCRAPFSTLPYRDPLRLLRNGFHELLGAGPGDETAALAFALTLAARASAQTGKSVCFCCAGSEGQERGLLYGHGFAGLGADPGRLLMVMAPGEKDLLWALEEAVTSGAFGAVAGVLPAGERLYGFAPSRRLKLRSHAKEMPLFLIRHWQGRGATAAHGRWRVGALPGLPEKGARNSVPLVGAPRLRLGLERMGGLPPQQWEIGLEAACDFHPASLLADGPAGKLQRRHQAA
jgi:hypothetical protein